MENVKLVGIKDKKAMIESSKEGIEYVIRFNYSDVAFRQSANGLWQPKIWEITQAQTYVKLVEENSQVQGLVTAGLAC